MSDDLRSKIDRSPTQSSEHNKSDNVYIITRSVKIAGKEYSAQGRASTEAKAVSLAKEALSRKISNDYETSGINSNNIDQKIGNPEPEDRLTSQMRREQSAAIDRESESSSDLSPSSDQPVNQNNSATQGEQKVFSKKAQTPREDNNKKVHRRTKKQKNHVPWTKAFQTGVGQTEDGPVLDGKGDFRLDEPVPTYPLRKGEKIIEGENNTAIVLGRDRSPTNRFVFSKSSSQRDYTSGYSDYMCAGAIDIVAGRMAPFPLKSSTVNKKYGNWVVQPSFNTERPADLQGEKLVAGDHPGFMMDAARIYISQMTNIDENFKIARHISTVADSEKDPADMRWDKQKVVPTSAIMLKADKVRMHSRQDIKIVTGGPSEYVNSLGNPIRQNNGIHLIAENGLDKDGNILPQHPMVLGNNLVKVLEYNCILMEDVVQSVDAMCEMQMRFNSVIKDNFHLIPIAGGTPDVPNPFTQLAGIVTQLELLVKTRFGALFQLINNFRARTTYLSESSDDQNFILSRHNTVN